MIDNVQKISRKLEKLIHTKLNDPGAPEPPRLVRANSAFDMLFSFMGEKPCAKEKKSAEA